MNSNITTATALPPAVLSPVGKAMEEVAASFDRFCLAAGIEALGEMMEKDAVQVCGSRHLRAETCRGLSLGPHAQQDRLSCRQDRCRATAGA